MLAVLGRAWNLCGRSGVDKIEELRSWGGLGPLLGSQWAALGAYVGGFGPLVGPMLAVLGRSWAYVDGLGGVLGPMLSPLTPPAAS